MYCMFTEIKLIKKPKNNRTFNLPESFSKTYCEAANTLVELRRYKYSPFFDAFFKIKFSFHWDLCMFYE